MHSQVLAEQTLHGTSLSLSVEGGSLVLQRKTGSLSERIALGRPTMGIGGARFVLSHSGRYLVVSLFSGQSEESYELIDMTPSLCHRGGLASLCGEGANFAFSDDESLLAMVYPLSCTGFSEADIEAAEPGGDGELLVRFGGIVLHHIDSGNQRQAAILAKVPPECTPEDVEFDADAFETSVHRDQLTFRTPWDTEAVVALPMPETVIVQGPR